MRLGRTLGDLEIDVEGVRLPKLPETLLETYPKVFNVSIQSFL